MEAADPSAVLVPVEEVCQYHSTFDGGLEFLVTTVLPQFNVFVNVVFGIAGPAAVTFTDRPSV
jgi:hypothetical protein